MKAKTLKNQICSYNKINSTFKVSKIKLIMHRNCKSNWSLYIHALWDIIDEEQAWDIQLWPTILLPPSGRRQAFTVLGAFEYWAFYNKSQRAPVIACIQ